MLLPGVKCKRGFLLILLSVLLALAEPTFLPGTPIGRSLDENLDGVRAGLTLRRTSPVVRRSIVERSASDETSGPDSLASLIEHPPTALIKLLMQILQLSRGTTEKETVGKEYVSMGKLTRLAIEQFFKLILEAVFRLLTFPIRAIRAVVPLPFIK